VIGAHDVVNPVARTDPKTTIAGMRILDVNKARTVIVIKRGLSPGFAGIPNPSLPPIARSCTSPTARRPFSP
jgi:NAD(P) transhydrogenase subunit beta